MARTVLAVQQPGLTLTTATRNSADNSNGNSFVWPGVPVVLNVRNTNASTRTLTLKANAGKTLGGMALADKAYTIAATTGDHLIVLSDPAGFLQDDGSVYLDWTASAGVDIALVRV
jgi:hypothetical protein